MKYFTSLFVCLIPGILIFAGINQKHQQKNIDHYKVTADNKAHPKITYHKKGNIPVVYDSKKSKAPVGEVIGKTTYDLQTNAGMCRRVATNPNGRYTYVGWTYDFSFSPGAANRGTGFNFYDNTSGLWQNEPTTRIEPNTKTGWPNIGVSQGRQFSIAHTGSAGMIFTYRTGNSEWQEKIVSEEASDNREFWARAVADPPYIYCIISQLPINDTYNNFTGGLNFIRSSNSGNDWEILGGLEQDYKDTFPLSIGADSYQIDAANGIVSVIVGSGLNSIVLYKSNNRGDDWTKQIILQNSNPFVKNISENSEVEDFTVDPYFASDGGNTVIIDSKGTTHIVFSGRISFNIADNDHINNSDNYFALRETAALFYWNESMGNTGPKIIGKSIMYDADADGQLGSSIDRLINSGIMPYYSNMVCHPQLAIDVEDNLYLSYSALVDGHFVPETVDFLSSDGTGEILPYQAEFDLNTTVYSDVFMLKSTDDGNNWQGPLNVTNEAVSEEAYGSIQRFIHDTIMLAYQHDPLPGIALQGHQDLTTINEIAVVKIAPEDISNDIAPPDSEPHLTILFDYLTLPQGCSVINEISLQKFSWGMDYPDGLITEIKINGLVDYSQPGNYTEEIYVEDSAGNKSDPVQVFVEIVADEEPPLIEIDQLCNTISIFVGSDWQVPEATITDLAEFDGVVQPSGCDVSGNLVVSNDVNVNEIGTYLINYSVCDFAGNKSNLELTINVIEEDTEGPVITFENFKDEIDQYEEISESDFIITAIDNVDCENVEINVDVTEMIGAYEITVTATDQSNNTTTETKIIKVCPNDADPCEMVNVENHPSNIPIVQLYPNPAKEMITVEIENYFNATNNLAFKIQISDLAGKNVYISNEVKATSQIEHTINTSNLNSGLYLLSIFNNNLNINKKIVIK